MEKNIKTSKGNQHLAIGWETIHSRLEAVREKLEKGWQITEQEKEQILMERTKALARESKDKTLTEEYLEVAEFILADERYGIELNFISEVYTLQDLTPMPCTPPFILGVTNIRGKILTVIDMKKMFELPDKDLNNLNKVIIVHANGMEAGILADTIIGIRSIPVENIQPALPTLTGIRAEYMKGVTGDQLIILNVVNIFSDERIIVNEGV